MSAPGIGVVIAGTKEFDDHVRKLVESLSDDETNKVFLAAARAIATAARRYAPRGKHPAFSAFGGRGRAQKWPGRLRQAIVAKAFSRAARRKFGPGAFAQVNLKPRMRVTAPYGHIVAGGRQRAVARQGHFFWRSGTGARDFVKTRAVAGFEGNDFWQRGVSEKADVILEKISESIQRQIAKRNK